MDIKLLHLKILLTNHNRMVMDNFLDFLGNSWISGIIIGIISSTFVFFITQYFLNKKAKKEYLHKISNANNELLFSLKSIFVNKEKNIEEIYLSVKRSLARKYDLVDNDLSSLESLVDDIIREIVTNTILTDEQKGDYCEILLKSKERKREVEKLEVGELDKAGLRKQEILNKISSISVWAALITFISSVLFLVQDIKTDSIKDNPIYMVLAILIGVVAYIGLFPLLMKLMSILRELIFKLQKDLNDRIKDLENRNRD